MASLFNYPDPELEALRARVKAKGFKVLKSSLPPIYGPQAILHLHYTETEHPRWGWPVRVVLVTASLGQGQMAPPAIMYSKTVAGVVQYALEMNWRIHETFR